MEQNPILLAKENARKIAPRGAPKLAKVFAPKPADPDLYKERSLRQLREQKDISQRDFARAIGITRTHLQRLEIKPWNKLSFSELGLLAVGFGIEASELVNRLSGSFQKSIIRASLASPFFIVDFSSAAQFASHLKRPRDFFIGTFSLAPQKSLLKDHTPQERFVYFLVLGGTLVISLSDKEHVIKKDESIGLQDARAYELYNPSPIQKATAVLVTIPSFVRNSTAGG